jgi:hypothetical protein
MKKLLVVLGLFVLVPGLVFAQVSTGGTYYVDYYANNAGPAPDDSPISAFDQIIRIVNVGTLGTPLTAPVGDICANIYVFDPDQEMIACCAEPITPNELDSAYVGKNLTYNTLTTYVPPSGVVKVVLTPSPTGHCDPTAPLNGADATLGAMWGTHLQRTGGYIFLTETEKHQQTLSAGEAGFLPQACSFVLYLGSGRGTCRSVVSSGQN